MADHATKKERELMLLGFDLSRFDPRHTLLFAISASFTSLMAHSLLQEKLVKIDGFQNSWFLLCFSSFFFAVAALFDPSARKSLLRSYKKNTFFVMAPIGIALCFERSFRNMALQKLDFMTLVVCQSAKAIPVLIIGKLMLNRNFTFLHYVNGFCVAAAVSLVSLADSQNSGTFSGLGVALMFASVTAEALKAVFSEMKVKSAGYSPSIVILWSNLTGFLLVFPISLLNGTLADGLGFFWEKPSCIISLLMFCGGGFFGTLANVLIMALSDAYLCTIQGSLRKLITILISAFTSGKTITWGHVLGILLSFGAVFMTTLLKKKK